MRGRNLLVRPSMKATAPGVSTRSAPSTCGNDMGATLSKIARARLHKLSGWRPAADELHWPNSGVYRSPEGSRSSIPQAHRELHAARRAGGNRLSEERRAQVADVVRIVDVVQRVEHVDAEVQGVLAPRRRRQREVARYPKIDDGKSGTLEAVARHAGRARVRGAGVKEIGARGQRVRPPCRRARRHADGDAFARGQRAERFEPVALVEV